MASDAQMSGSSTAIGGRLDGRPLLTGAAMRATEAAAITEDCPGAELMRRAGDAVVSAILAQWRGFAVAPARAVVLCGPGNNGGDGYVVARLLARRGWDVAVFSLGDPAAHLPDDAAAARDAWRGHGPVGTFRHAAQAIAAADLVVDAMFGIGLSRPLDDPALKAVLAAMADKKVVAIDIPSGLCADSGRVLGEACVRAGLTVSFHAPKPGHLLAEGPRHCGALRVMPIGLSDIVDAPLLTRAPAGLSKQGDAHKYGHGHALVLAGGAGRGGAARMAARAALRVGSGLVTLGCPPEALAENAARLDAIMLRRVADPGALTDLLADGRLNALCLGPGLGQGAADLACAALAAGRGCVLDADALSGFAEAPDQLFGQLHEDCVLTPHGGEFARLFPDLSERLTGPVWSGPADSKIDLVREAAARAGCVVLLKGADSVIAAPDGRVRVNAARYDRAAPWLATAGAGDVLAGMICGLLARGWPVLEAASDAAWLHVEAARRIGPGLIAEDLPEALPGLFAALPPR